MSSTYERVNYRLRPAKHIERKMLVEAFRNLSEFGMLSSYRYIGFGSIYFSDFSLIHKALGITNMISIEKDANVSERFLFNRPFNCIDIQFGYSTGILEKLSWDQRTILWLDYDGTLKPEVFTDIQFFITRAPAGSVIVITVNAKPPSLNSGLSPDEIIPALAKTVDDLKKRLGENKVPPDITGRDLRKWGTAKVYRRIITNQIEEAVSIRNGTRVVGNKLLYKQLFNFHYADGTKMLTVGGIIYDEGQQGTLEKCMFDRLEFVRSDDSLSKIDVPKLTYRELSHLDKQLPIEDLSTLHAPGIPEEDCEKYSRVYRFFPTFAETEL